MPGKTDLPDACRAQKLHPYPAGPPCQKPSSIRRLWPLNTFAENSRLYSPAMARLTPLTMVETGLLSFSNCLFRAIRRLPPAGAALIITGRTPAHDGLYTRTLHLLHLAGDSPVRIHPRSIETPIPRQI